MQDGFKFNVFVMLFLALLFAAALKELRARLKPGLAAWVPAVAVLLVALEFLPPWPMPMHGLAAPAVIERLRDRPDGAILPLPVGAIFNGLSGHGLVGKPWLPIDLQPIHQKPYVGGYLTRVSRRNYDWVSQDPFLQALIRAQSGGEIAPLLRDPAKVARYLRNTRIEYVLVERSLVPEAFPGLIKTWPLRLIDEDETLRLYQYSRQAPTLTGRFLL